jgi:hypothetical protein
MKKQGYVYWIHCIEHTDPYTQGYIGVTNNLESRFRDHKYRSQNPHLKAAFNKYIDIVIDAVFVGDYDFCYIIEEQYRPNTEIGWNINQGGYKPPDVTGIRRSAETRRLISENNVGFRGRKHSEETKRKMSEKHKGKGRPHTEETKLKLSMIRKQIIANKLLVRNQP